MLLTGNNQPITGMNFTPKNITKDNHTFEMNFTYKPATVTVKHNYTNASSHELTFTGWNGKPFKIGKNYTFSPEITGGYEIPDQQTISFSGLTKITFTYPVKTPQLVLHYDFEENLRDQGQRNLSGSVQDTMKWATGKLGKAIDLSNAYIRVKSHQAIRFADTMTLMTWIRMPSAPTSCANTLAAQWGTS